MTSRVAAAVGVWRGRQFPAARDRAYVAYLTLLLAAVVIFPTARAIWLTVVSPAGIAALTSSLAPEMAGIAALAIWIGALVLGRQRGPALLPPFLTYSLATSDLPRSVAFRGPLLRGGVVVVAGTTLAAAIVGGALLHTGSAGAAHALIFALAGACTGVIALALALIGQAFPRAASAGAALLLGFGMLSVIAPAVQPFMPWGWVALAYPAHSLSDASIALAAVAVAAAVAIPGIASRLNVEGLVAQSLRWNSASAASASFDFSAAASVYRPRPHAGRRIDAIAVPRTGVGTFLLRDLVGALRTPVRLAVGAATVMAAGALVAAVGATALPGWIVGATAGFAAFVGTGPLSDGLRHAAAVASDLPLYGIADERLLAFHLAFPGVATLGAMTVGAGGGAALIGAALWPSIGLAVVLGIAVVLVRIGSSLKGPMPASLLTPIPTPAGDLAAVTRLMWAVDGVVLVGLAGAAVAVLPSTAIPVMLVGTSVALLVARRWRRRRTV